MQFYGATISLIDINSNNSGNLQSSNLNENVSHWEERTKTERTASVSPLSIKGLKKMLSCCVSKMSEEWLCKTSLTDKLLHNNFCLIITQTTSFLFCSVNYGTFYLQLLSSHFTQNHFHAISAVLFVIITSSRFIA